MAWTDPITGRTGIPQKPGDILNAAISYWEGVVMETRNKRPRTIHGKEEKLATIEMATERLNRYRGARRSFNPNKYNDSTVDLARKDLMWANQ